MIAIYTQQAWYNTSLIFMDSLEVLPSNVALPAYIAVRCVCQVSPHPPQGQWADPLDCDHMWEMEGVPLISILSVLFLPPPRSPTFVEHVRDATHTPTFTSHRRCCRTRSDPCVGSVMTARVS